MAPPADRGLVGRVAWHAGLAWRSSRWAALAAFAIGLFVRAALPVQDSWVAAAVAVGCALLAVALLALGEARRPSQAQARPVPTDPAAALEARGAADQVAHALARAALVLGGFAVGVGLGGLLGLRLA